MSVARVFPRKTTASPDDALAFFGPPSNNISHSIDQVHISVTFTYDIDRAKELASAWENVAPVIIGGPALDDPGGNFVPGMYVKRGYVITSRGCPNNCWFCSVHKREGDIRELPITYGHNLLDSNILACSDKHIGQVFSMLKGNGEPVQLTGGLEAKLLTHQHVCMLWDLRPVSMFFAYDTPDNLDPLIRAGELLRFANFTRSHLRCYVLIGYQRDTFEEAEKRLIEAWTAGFLPMAMLWKNKTGCEDQEWRRFQRTWARPPATKAHMKTIFNLEKP